MTGRKNNMGVIYDSLDDVTRTLADTIAETKGLDKELAAIAAKAGEGADAAITGALNVARAAGDPDKNMQAAARIKIIDGDLEELTTKYDGAVKNNQLRDLVGLKRRITELGQEKATLQSAINLSKVAGGE
jgi:hypothetical protein